MPETRTEMLLSAAAEAADALVQIKNMLTPEMESTRVATAAHAELTAALAQWSHLQCEHCHKIFEDRFLFRVRIEHRQASTDEWAQPTSSKDARWCGRCLREIASVVVVRTTTL